MEKAIGMVEFSSIARGIETCDLMLKASKVDLVKSSTVCPGKYIVIIGGATGNVQASMEVAMGSGREYVIDKLIIPNIHSQVIPAIGLTNPVDKIKSIGVLEFYSIASGIMAADIAAKASQVTLVEVKIGYAIGGKGVVILTGDVSSVETACRAAQRDTELLVQVSIIPRPSVQLIENIFE